MFVLDAEFPISLLSLNFFFFFPSVFPPIPIQICCSLILLFNISERNALLLLTSSE